MSSSAIVSISRRDHHARHRRTLRYPGGRHRSDAPGLRGKPAPDTFLAAARRLEVDPARAMVVEDAAAGVIAGRAGDFGLVIGVDRGGQSASLREAGAHCQRGSEQSRIEENP